MIRTSFLKPGNVVKYMSHVGEILKYQPTATLMDTLVHFHDVANARFDYAPTGGQCDVWVSSRELQHVAGGAR